MRSILIIFLAAVAFKLSGQSPDSEKLFERAHENHASGNYQDALRLFDECLQKTPFFTEAYSARAATKVELKDLAGALTDYSITIERQPANFDARLGRANVLYKLKRYAEARDEYLWLLRLDPGETTTIYFQKSASPTGTVQITSAQSDFHPIILNYLGLTELRLDNLQAAKARLDSAIALRPREADYYVNRGLVREKLDDPRAKDDFDKAVEINPQHTAALTALANSKATKSNSLKFLNEAIESDSSVLQPFLERAFHRMQSGAFKEALDDYNHALKIESSDPEIWLNRGYVKEKLSDLTGAFNDLTIAISLKEDYAKAWLNRGNVLQKQGKLAEALEDYSVAITYEPEYAAAYYNRGIVKQRLKQKKEACTDIRKARDLGMTISDDLMKAACE